MTDHGTPDDIGRDDGRLVDHLLGEGTCEERESVRSDIASDIDLAVEFGELRALFEDMRSLSVAPTGNVSIAVRYAVDRRARLRNKQPISFAGTCVRVAAVAAAALVAFVLIDRGAQSSVREFDVTHVVSTSPSSGRRAPGPDEQLAALLSTETLPIDDPSFVASLRPFEGRPLPNSFAGYLDASERLDGLREQFRLRFARDERHRLLRSMGSPQLDDRLDSLSRDVAAQIENRISRGRASVDELSLAIRAMVASGSSRLEGAHRDTVQRCVFELLQQFEAADEGEGATSLAALSELAVIEGGRLVDFVGYYSDRLARATLSPGDGGRRPTLLHWRTPASRLADAGRVLQLAPAFGVHAGVAHRARMMIAAHLDERLAIETEIETPSLVAAQLYGFGDLIDRAASDRALRLWNPRLLVPDFVALHHLAWSRAPTRPGWARFQAHLRDLTSLETPARVRDSASLLLCLTMNFAAPDALGGTVAKAI